MSKSIRTMKREMLDDEKVAGLSDADFRLWQAILLLADDHGRFRADPRQLAARVWWAAAVRRESRQVAEALDGMSELGLIDLYEVKGQLYGAVRGWTKHQRVDNAAKAEFPGKEEGIQASAANRGELRRLAAGEERKGEEGRGLEGTLRGPSAVPPPARSVSLPPLAVADPDSVSKVRVRPQVAKGSRLSEDWQPKATTVVRFRDRGYDPLKARPSGLAVLDEFRNHWTSATGANASKTNWDAAFSNWVSRAIDERKCPQWVRTIDVPASPKRESTQQRSLLDEDPERAAEAAASWSRVEAGEVSFEDAIGEALVTNGTVRTC